MVMTLGKAEKMVFRALIFPALPSVFYRALDKGALGKEKRPSRRQPHWQLLCRVPTLQALGKEFLFFFTKILCRVPTLQALGKDFFYFFKKFLCRVPSGRHSAKLEFFLNFFAECSLSGTRQSLNFFLKKISMASAMVTTLGKDFFIFI